MYLIRLLWGFIRRLRRDRAHWELLGALPMHNGIQGQPRGKSWHDQRERIETLKGHTVLIVSIHPPCVQWWKHLFTSWKDATWISYSKQKHWPFLKQYGFLHSREAATAHGWSGENKDKSRGDSKQGRIHRLFTHVSQYTEPGCGPKTTSYFGPRGTKRRIYLLRWEMLIPPTFIRKVSPVALALSTAITWSCQRCRLGTDTACWLPMRIDARPSFLGPSKMHKILSSYLLSVSHPFSLLHPAINLSDQKKKKKNLQNPVYYFPLILIILKYNL